MDYAYEFVIKNHGIDTEKDYPYQGREKTCNKEKVCNSSTNPSSLTPSPEGPNCLSLRVVF